MLRLNKISKAEWSLYLLITSFFICVPIGRYQIFGIRTDFRVYDFVGFFFLLYNFRRVLFVYRFVKKEHFWFLYYGKWLIVVVFISIWVSVFYSGPDVLPPLIIRFYRFFLYFMSGAFAVSVVTNGRIYKRALSVFHYNIVVQAFLAFFQGIGILGSFWPDYWINNYGARNFAVGMLSPHHKQIGVIMLLGISLTAFMLLQSRSVIRKVMYLLFFVVMFFVPLFEGTKTFLFSILGMFIAFLYHYRFKGMSVVSMLGVIILAFGMYWMPESGKENINMMFEERVGRWVEEGNISKLMTGRDKIYWASFDALLTHPYLWFTGTGFQNISAFVPATGAHNNYLHYLMETGLVGFTIFLFFLYRAWKNLLLTYRIFKGRFIGEAALFGWIFFVGLLFSLFTGEVLYAQYSMFTLAGQILLFLGILIAPLFWEFRYNIRSYVAY